MNDNRIPSNSPDLTQENIEKLKGLFPEILTDGKVDFDMLRTILGEEVDDRSERYRFEWHGKRASLLGAQQPSKGTLRPDKESSKNFDKTENLYIEGDNLEVLKLLQKSYNSKVKMIYIDPPYNTGNDFVYEDDFKDNFQSYLEQTGQVDEEGRRLSTNTESNGRYHTDWLNLMYPRLKLARNILTDDGVIFISIDENEVANLKKLCDEIFGATNFVSQITTLCNPKGRSQDKFFATNHEYILIYSKRILNKGAFSIAKDEEQIEREYPNIDVSGQKYRLIELRNTHREFGKHNRPNLFYPIYVNDSTGEVSLTRNPNTVKVLPVWEDGYEGCWTWDMNRALKDKELLEAKLVKDSWKIYRKSFSQGTVKMLKTIFNDNRFYTEKGQKEIFELFNTKEKIFESPKSVELIKLLCETTLKENDIILDFFSGSATTAHAIMKLNAEDNGNRKFIMVQLPEKVDKKSEAFKAGYENICGIGKDRIRRAGEKIIKDHPKTVDSLDIGFKVLKLDKSNIREWNVDFEELEEQITSYDNMFVSDHSELDVVYEIILKSGLELTCPVNTFQVDGKNIYDIVFGNLFICLDDNIDTTIAQAIIDKRNDYGIETSSVVFADHGFHGNDSEKLNCFKLLEDAGYQHEQLMTI